MKRREFVTRFGLGGLLGSSLVACSTEEKAGSTMAKSDSAKDQIWEWKMVTTWPKNFPVLGTGAEQLADMINTMSGGRLKIKVYASGELVPAFECFDVVSQGAVQMGHGAAYYWQGKNPAFQFFSTVPFGMNTVQMNAWLYEGEGLKLWKEAYQSFGVLPFPAGNTGMQMAGWFNREINSIDDLKGLKMRIPGLGGKVFNQAGGTAVTLPGGELLTSMQTGVIDATEWINPYADVAFGLHKVAKYYYYPGWHEPGTTLECIVNKAAMEALPQDLQQIISVATKAVNGKIGEEYMAKNGDALHDLKKNSNVQIRPLPDDVLRKLGRLSNEVVNKIADDSPFSRRVYNSYLTFKEKTQEWENISEKMYYQISSYAD